MKTYGIIGVAVLLLVATAQAVNTISTLTGKGLGQTLPGQVGSAGPWNEEGTGEQGTPLQILAESDGLFEVESDTYLHVWAVAAGEQAACTAQTVEGPAIRPVTGLIDGLDPNTGVGASGHWSTGARTYSDIGVVNAGGSIVLPALEEGGWIPVPLVTGQESFIMELVVFPSLGAMILVFVARLLVVRVRRRRSRSRLPQLLQV
ncbi:MAG: hypothetical protein ABFE13_06605 [Phycisphaerales bacterium]